MKNLKSLCKKHSKKCLRAPSDLLDAALRRLEAEGLIPKSLTGRRKERFMMIEDALLYPEKYLF